MYKALFFSHHIDENAALTQRTASDSSDAPAVEKARFAAALDTVRQQFTILFEKAKADIGEEQAAITV